MKNITKIVSTAVVLLSLATPVFAAAPFAASKELRKDACANAVGAPIVNIEHKVKNDVDSGMAGNYWAWDKYERHITVYKTTTDGVFCAIVKYDGKFTTVDGRSPGNTADLTAGITGEMKGGYRATFNATLKSEPTMKKFGNVGSFDYQCNLSGECTGIPNWRGWYFDNVANFDQPWWGWKYKAEGGHGTWINASTGSVGDILPVSAHQGDKEEESD